MTNLGSKCKFYTTNQDVFLRYFESIEQYQALIRAGNFKKLEEIIKDKSHFDLSNFDTNILISQ